MGSRQISDHQRAWLNDQLAVWTEAGLIEGAQAERILATYETSAATGERKHSLARFALQSIAAFFLALSVLLVIGYNWQAFPWIGKLVIVFGGLLGVQSLGMYLRFRTPRRRAAEIVFFFGCLLFGAGIWLVAQVFNLSSHYPDGVWWWAIGVLPFAIALDTVLMHVLLVGLLALWAGMEVTGFSHFSYRLLWFSWPNGAYTLPLLAVPGLIWAYRRGSAATVGLYAPLLAWWIILQTIAWHLEWQSVYVVGALGAMFLIVAENHSHRSRLAIPYRVYGTLMVGGALIPASFLGFHHGFGWRGVNHPAAVLVGLFMFILVPLAALVAFTFLLRPLDARQQHPLARLAEVARRQWIPFGLVLAMALMSLASLAAEGAHLLSAVIANLAMLGFAIWLMRVGLREERGRPFAAGVLYFLLWAILRYADLFGAAGGMLGAALMFFLCGLTLFGLARFWGKRKELRHAG